MRSNRLRNILAAVILGGFISSSAHAGLIHRYSFTNGAKDSVGTVDGALKGSDAKIENGKLELKNDASASGEKVSHLAFSASVLPKESATATLIIWFTSKDTGAFSRLIDIGDSDGSEGKAFFYFSPRTADDVSRAAITATDVGGRVPLDNDRLDDGKPHMAAIVFDGPAKKMRVFIDGKEPKGAESIEDAPLDKVKPVHSYIGRSAFDADAGLTASVDEFRVYDTALTADEIAAIQKAGADALPPAKP